MSGNSRCERSQFAYNDGISLTDLANRFGSDKGMLMGIGGPPHRYTYLYDLLLAPYRTRSINFLEFGLIIHDPQGGATGGEKSDRLRCRCGSNISPKPCFRLGESGKYIDNPLLSVDTKDRFKRAGRHHRALVSTKAFLWTLSLRQVQKLVGLLHS
jgi:hypothetical protein